MLLEALHPMSRARAVVLRRKRYGLFMFICFLMSNSSGLAKVFSHLAASSFTLLRLFFRGLHAKIQTVWYAIV